MIPRRWCALALALTLVIGPLPREFPGLLPEVVVDHAGDVLWATAVLLGFALLWPRWPVPRLAAVAGLIALAVELQQLYQPQWLVDFRSRRLPGLVLGRGFLWADLVAYALGVGLGVVIVRWISANRSTGSLTTARS